MNLSTVYLNLKEDWRQEGRQEGRQFTMQQVAIGLLRRQSDMDLILEITGLNRQQIQQISDRLAAGETPEAILKS